MTIVGVSGHYASNWTSFPHSKAGSIGKAQIALGRPPLSRWGMHTTREPGEELLSALPGGEGGALAAGVGG